MFDIVSNITSFKKYTDISNRNSISLMFSNGSSGDKVVFP